tara:strand:+ start:1227 stop:1559 length:333 start_codon:yes stop_codon:yes gene_type:complete
MAETFKYVQGDTGPQLRITLTDEDTGTATDLTGGTVKMHFRAAGSTTLLFTKTLTISSPANGGIVLVSWASGELNQDPGTYHGEIEVTRSGGVVETLYDVIKFKIREDFA